MTYGRALSVPSARETIELAVVSDAAYVEPIGVMLHSILRWHEASTLRVHWVHVRMDRRSLHAARDLCRTAGLRVNMVAGDSVLAGAGWPADVNPTLLKIFLPELLTDVDERLLYLDGDLVVEGPLWPLWRTDFQARAVVGVRDSWIGTPGFWATFPQSAAVTRELWMRHDYINAGVLLYDLARCRALDLAARCSGWLSANRGALFFEQDALNVTLADAIALAPPAWNVLGRAANYVRPSPTRAGYSADELLQAYRNPQIVHFAGSQKPWGDAGDRYALSPRYFRARRNTPWHRRLSAAQHLDLAVLDLAHRIQCARRLRAAGAILYARKAVVWMNRRFKAWRGANHARP